MSLKTIILAMVLFSVSYFANAQSSPREKLIEALNTIQNDYVDSLSDEILVDAAIKGMFTALDPHSKYFSAREGKEMKTMMSGSFVGIGIQFIMQHDSVFVTQVLPDGPAEKAGIMAGDRILKINNEVVTGTKFSNLDILKKIRGTNKSAVDMELYRAVAHRTFNLKLVRGAVADHSIKAAYMLDGNIGYISIGIFSQTTQPEIEDALKSLKGQGMKQLILDIQGNGGGYVEAALGVADEFLKKNQLVYYTVGRDKGRDYYYGAAAGTSFSGKLVVLVDQGTASASELLAGALQDWDRAVIVGRRTFGKGLTQRPVPLHDGSILELTGARLYTPAGRSLQKPYKNVDYNGDIKSRYQSGELFSTAALDRPDSLKKLTLINKRVVYSGSGITPDKLVPLDTLQGASWLKAVAAAGAVSDAAWNAIDKNRAELKKAYPAFDDFNSKYKVSLRLINDIAKAAEKQGIKTPVKNKDRLFQLLALEIKAEMASELFSGHPDYLRVINQENKSIQEAVSILKDDQRYVQFLDPKISAKLSNH